MSSFDEGWPRPCHHPFTLLADVLVSPEPVPAKSLHCDCRVIQLQLVKYPRCIPEEKYDNTSFWESLDQSPFLLKEFHDFYPIISRLDRDNLIGGSVPRDRLKHIPERANEPPLLRPVGDRKDNRGKRPSEILLEGTAKIHE